MKISVIIPAYNEERYLPGTLAAIHAASGEIDCEIVVVDNKSLDGTAAIAMESGAVVISETEHNISRVRNAGAAIASGDILIFIDADTFVPPPLLIKIHQVMTDSVCLGGAVAVEYDAFKRKWMKYYMLGWHFWSRFFNMKQGAAQFCRKDVFEKLKGYNEKIFVGEDIEFYWRLTKFAKRNRTRLFFVEEPKVKTSSRRLDKMSLYKTFLLMNPIFIRLNWKNKSSWNDWYEKTVR